MSPAQDPATTLQSLLHEGIPLTQAMQLTVIQADPNQLEISAPLEPNRNVHGTAFAGSLYALGMLTAWTLITQFLRTEGVDAVMVQQSGGIDYLRPVTDRIRCRCSINEETFARFRRALEETGRSRLEAEVTIGSQDSGEPAARLHGRFAARLRQPE